VRWLAGRFSRPAVLLLPFSQPAPSSSPPAPPGGSYCRRHSHPITGLPPPITYPDHHSHPPTTTTTLFIVFVCLLVDTALSACFYIPYKSPIHPIHSPICIIQPNRTSNRLSTTRQRSGSPLLPPFLYYHHSNNTTTTRLNKHATQAHPSCQISVCRLALLFFRRPAKQARSLGGRGNVAKIPTCLDAVFHK
jgi:hypothetical protein